MSAVDPQTDLKPGDRVHDTILDETGTFKHYYERNGTRFAAILFDGDERPIRIHIEDLTVVGE